MFDVSVLKDENLGLYHDREATKPVEGLRFGLLKLKEPLRTQETGTRSVFIRNQSGIALFLIEPCREVVVDGRSIGFMNPDIFNMNGDRIKNLCDPPSLSPNPRMDRDGRREDSGRG